MTFVLFETPVESVRRMDLKYPDRQASFIFEHLLEYCSKFDPLPAISIAVEGDGLFVTRGHKYLDCAVALARPTIRAVLPTGSDEVRKALLSRPDVKVLDWEAIKSREATDVRPRGWHVLFLQQMLSATQKLHLENEIREQFGDITLRVSHDDSRRLAEFEAQTPVTDIVWGRAWLDRLSTFSRHHVEIVSYQGDRFGA